MDQQVAYLILDIFAAYLLGAFFLIMFLWLRHRGKIRVNIILNELKLHLVTWGKPFLTSEGMRCLIVKENKKKKVPEWSPKVKELITYHTRFGRKKDEVFIYPDAEETIEFKDKAAEVPKFDKQTMYKWLQSNVITRRGEGTKPPVPMWILYVILGMGFITLIIGVMLYLKLGRL